jgi:hypothetical protein
LAFSVPVNIVFARGTSFRRQTQDHRFVLPSYAALCADRREVAEGLKCVGLLVKTEKRPEPLCPV